MLKQAAAAMLFGPCVLSLAFAIGDSGGCGNLERLPLGKALRNGTPQDIDKAILEWVDREAPRFSITYSREQAILNLIEASYGNKKPPPCVPNAPLIFYALDAGNAEAVRHLLGKPVGVKPRVPPRVLFYCEYRWYSASSPPANRRRAYEVLFERKAVEVSGPPNGVSVLGVCKEPELVALFLEHGARPDVDFDQGGEKINYLEMAIRDALQFDEDSYTAQKLYALERIKLFSKYMPASIEGRPYQSHIRQSCSRIIGGKPWNPRNCKALQLLVRGAPTIAASEVK